METFNGSTDNYSNDEGATFEKFARPSKYGCRVQKRTNLPRMANGF